MRRLPAALPLLLAGALFARSADDELSRADLAKRGKAATALVECPGRKAYGSAFCVSPAGLFVTNDHVVRGEAADAAVTVVLNPGQADEKVLQARVVRADPDADLALLQAADVRDLPALPLGSTDGLTELAEVVAFGFPFGTALAADRAGYPAVSVNAGRVTALRQKRGELDTLQVDAVLNPGNSGGPVLDRGGKVVGVVVAGVRGAGVNFAVPVGRLRRFVERPEITFLPPAVPPGAERKPAAFEARVLTVLPPRQPLRVDLVLGAPGRERQTAMQLADGVYRAAAPPVVAPDGPARVRVTATLADGLVSGTTPDQAVRVGDRAGRLSDFRALRWKPAPGGVLADRQAVDGPVAGLDKLDLQVGAGKVAVPVGDLVSAQVAPDLPDAVPCAVVVRAGEAEVGRAEAVLRLAGGTGWNDLDASEATAQDDYLHLPAGDKKIRTRAEYRGPVEITVVARTEKNNLRIRARKTAGLIFNWEVDPKQFRVHRPDGAGGEESGSLAAARPLPLAPNRWYTIRWRITGEGMTVAVDGQVVFEEKRAYDLSAPAPVGVHSCESALDVKSFVVKPLD